MEMDNELIQMAACVDSFRTLTYQERERMLRYLRDRFVDHPKPTEEVHPEMPSS